MRVTISDLQGVLLLLTGSGVGKVYGEVERAEKAPARLRPPRLLSKVALKVNRHFQSKI